MVLNLIVKLKPAQNPQLWQPNWCDPKRGMSEAQGALFHILLLVRCAVKVM